MAAHSSPMRILVALTGRSHALDVHAGVRVDSVQQALLSFTGVPVSDQLLMYNGSRLDPSKTLAAYGLPLADPSAADDFPVFLYCRSSLKPGGRVPELELPQPIIAEVALEPVLLGDRLRHPLASSSATAVRGLPETELRFQHDLSVAQALWSASQRRLAVCRQLLSEQEGQQLATDVARANVKTHLAHLKAAHERFIERYEEQAARHDALLGTFEPELSALARVALHPQLTTVGGWRSLQDLLPVAKLREWGEHCRRSHGHFRAKVGELDALVAALMADAEALLAQPQVVDLAALSRELSAAEAGADQLSLVVQSLGKDLRTAQQLVEQAVRELADPGAGSGGSLHDSISVLAAIGDIHASELLPQGYALDAATSEFWTRCVSSKSTLTSHAAAALQSISAQQCRIRDLKSKLAAFSEVLSRQDGAFAQLKMVARIPVAYRMLLAECMRRRAWQQLLSQQATRIEEHLGRLRAKEAQREAAFLKQIDRYLPSEAVHTAGLMHSEPPSVRLQLEPHPSAGLAPPLLPVSLPELQRLPLPAAGRSLLAVAEASGVGASDAEMAAELSAAPEPLTGPPCLELENARLKSELAGYIAAACARELVASEAGRDAGAGYAGSAAAPGPMAAAAAAAAVAAPAGPPGKPPPAARAKAPATPTAAAAAGAAAGVAPPDVVAALQRAVELKDDLAALLQAQVVELRGQCAAQQATVSELQVQVEVLKAAATAAAAANSQDTTVPKQQEQQQQQRGELPEEVPGRETAAAIDKCDALGSACDVTSGNCDAPGGKCDAPAGACDAPGDNCDASSGECDAQSEAPPQSPSRAPAAADEPPAAKAVSTALTPERPGGRGARPAPSAWIQPQPQRAASPYSPPPQRATSPYSPQPLLMNLNMGPIALAALGRPASAGPQPLGTPSSEYRPGSAGPMPTLGGGVAATAHDARVPAVAAGQLVHHPLLQLMHSAGGGGGGEHGTAAATAATAAVSIAAAVPLLTPFTSAASRGSGGDEATGVPPASADPAMALEAHGRNAAAAVGAVSGGSGSSAAQIKGLLHASNLLLLDSMVAGAMDEVSAGSPTGHDVPSAMRRSNSGGGTPGESPRRQQSERSQPRTPFGSLPFATSLPMAIGSGSGNSGAMMVGTMLGMPCQPRRSSGCGDPGGSSVGSASAGAAPPGASPANQVLASVMRAAGDEPAPLPWAKVAPAAMAVPAMDDDGGGMPDLMESGLAQAGGLAGQRRCEGSGMPGGARQHGSGAAGVSGDDAADDDVPDLDDLISGQDEGTAKREARASGFLSVHEGDGR